MKRIKGGHEKSGLHRHCACPCSRRNRGHSLIEVLVALVVLAVAALGAGATVFKARRAAHQSSLTSAAVQLAARVADNMQANAPAMAGSDSANPYLQLDYDALADGPPAMPGDCSADRCDSAALADADLAAVRRDVYEHYPPGRVKICRDGAAWDPAAASLHWDCDGAAGAPVMVKIGWREQQASGPRAASAAPLLVALPIASGAAMAGTP